MPSFDSLSTFLIEFRFFEIFRLFLKKMPAGVEEGAEGDQVATTAGGIAAVAPQPHRSTSSPSLPPIIYEVIFSTKRLGLGLKSEGGQTVVSSTQNPTVTTGDILISVANENVQYRPPGYIRRLLVAHSKRPITVQFQRSVTTLKPVGNTATTDSPRHRLLQLISEHVTKFLARQDDLGSEQQLLNDNLNSLPDHKPNTSLHTLAIFFAHMIALKKVSDHTAAAAAAAAASNASSAAGVVGGGRPSDQGCPDRRLAHPILIGVVGGRRPPDRGSARRRFYCRAVVVVGYIGRDRS